MAEALVKKRRIRAGHRAVVTKRMGELEALLGGSEGPSKRDKLKYTSILQEKLDILRQLDGEIVELLEEETDMASEIEQADTFNQEVLDFVLRVKELPSVDTAPTTSGSGGPDVTSVSKSSSVARLPKLSLRSFDGDITQWLSFWDSYQAAVHSNPDLSDVQKFTYLKTLVERSAREAISGLALSDDNYKEALTILEKRFGNKQKIIAKHMDILLNIDPVTSPDNVQSLRRLYDRAESNVRALRTLGVSPDSYGSLLSSVMVQKLPQELRLLVSRKVTGDWDLEAIMKVVGEELEARERAVMPRDDLINSHVKGRAKEKSSATSLLVGRADGQKRSCCYCSQGHDPCDCGVVTSLEERKRVLRTAARCFVCLKRGHIARECRSRTRCQSCNGRHHRSICQTNEKQSPTGKETDVQPTRQLLSQADPAPPRLNPSARPFESKSTCCLSNGKRDILLQTAQVHIFNPIRPDNCLRAIILFGTGSQRSYITQSAAKDHLQLTTQGTKVMSVATFGTNTRIQQQCKIVRVGISKGDFSITIPLLLIPTICEPMTVSPCTEALPAHLRELELANTMSTYQQVIEPAILIGLDHYWDFITGETIRPEQGGPVAVRTSLGWILSGPVTSEQYSGNTSLVTHTLKVTATSTEEDRRLERQLKAFWDLETLGITDAEGSLYEQFEKLVRFHDGHYQVMLPWKDLATKLPNNYQLCLKRLQALSRRLKQNPELLQQYDSVIQEQLRMGIVEAVVDPELTQGERVHYLPHHAIVKRDKTTTKLRVVYDASARSNGPSLNQCLHVGPKFNQRILDILLRFRTHKTALVADIEKAFLMVAIDEKDRDVLRFLWFEDVTKEPMNIRVLKFTRVVFGVAASPFLLNATVRHHLEGYRASYPEVVQQLVESIYVDDVVTGSNNLEQTFQLYRKSKEILGEGGFNLRKFQTNNVDLQKRIQVTEGNTCNSSEPETYAKVTLGNTQRTQQGEQKVLGVRWKVDTDEFVIDLTDVIEASTSIVPTKRNVISIIGRVYDPFGMLSPVVILFKIYFQELCAAKLEWDEPLPTSVREKWDKLLGGLRNDKPIKIPRCIRIENEDESASYRLCAFGDASSRAFAVVLYLLAKNSTSTRCHFICSKTRVAPIEGLTIPRLELLSALLVAKLVNKVTNILDGEILLQQPWCFLDSKVACCWIAGEEKSWQPFVQNRVEEIRRLVPIQAWRHCAGSLNPADAPSRGQTLVEFAGHVEWLNGPEWLLALEEEQQQVYVTLDGETPRECALEMMVPKDLSTLSIAEKVEVEGIGNILDIGRYSDLDRLLRITARILFFIELLRAQLPSVISPELLHKAELQWIKWVQPFLKEEKCYEVWKRQLGLFCDSEGIWRCRGRLQNAGFPYSTQHPILLPHTHTFVLLLVKQAHEKVFHNGVKETLTQLRSRYWIIKGRSVVRQVLNKCVICRRMEGMPYVAPPPPPLPHYRVNEAPPFAYSGVDFAGPLFVKMDKTASCSSKLWICLYTCCVTRAIHLDLVPDMTTQSFMRCFRRFVARRGLPKKVLSDNGKTFKGAAKVIRKIMTHDEVQRHFPGHQVEWTFNVERAPWWGGIFERLIQSTKRCLRKTIGRAKISYDELLTILMDIEIVLNSRPLSFVSSLDVEEPLTPSHLLVGRRLLSVPDFLLHSDAENDEDYMVTPAVLTKRMKFLCRAVDHFWKRWRKEYLLELRSAHVLRNKGHLDRCIAEGDVVVVHDENERRGFWKVGVVERLLPGRDGQVRSAHVRITTNGKVNVWGRPIQRLYPLEVNCHQGNSGLGIQPDTRGVETTEDENDENNAIIENDENNAIIENDENNVIVGNEVVEDNAIDDRNTGAVPRSRPSRAAAVKARNRILLQTMKQ